MLVHGNRSTLRTMNDEVQSLWDAEVKVHLQVMSLTFSNISYKLIRQLAGSVITHSGYRGVLPVT
jgi:hypothetical protein